MKKMYVFSRFPASPRALRHMADPGHCPGHALNRVWLLRARHAHPARRKVGISVASARARRNSYTLTQASTFSLNSSSTAHALCKRDTSPHSVHIRECGKLWLIMSHVARPMARGVQEVMRTPRRQRAHDVVVKSVGRAGDSRARGRRGLDGRGRRRADRAMAQPVGRRPTADRCRRGADRGIVFRFCHAFVTT